MSSNLLNEELHRMKYLFDHQRGVVESEQKKDPKTWSPYDWKGKSQGKLNFYATPIYAKNIRIGDEKDMYGISSSTHLPKLTPIMKEKVDTEKPNTRYFPKLKLIKDAFPYPDNMIGPKFESYSEAKEVFNNFLVELTIFLKEKKALDNIESINIQGTADAAPPTSKVPRGYKELDHSLVGDTTPYGGLTDLKQMNQYLADSRAKVLGDMIIKRVKDDSGFDISNKIKYLPGINYYGQDGKRGQDYRSVTVTPKYIPVQVTPDVPPKTEYEYFITLNDSNVPVKPVEPKNNMVKVHENDIKRYNINLPWRQAGTFNNKQTVKGKIENRELFVDNVSFGGIDYKDSDDNQSGDSTVKYVSQAKPVFVKFLDDYYYIQMLQFTFHSY